MYILIATISLMLTLLMEYSLHRYYLHLPNNDHLTNHHMNYHGKREFIHDGISFKDVASSHIYILLTALPGSILSLVFTNILGFFLALGYAYFIEWAHFKIHSGNHPKWINPLFVHHKIHHISYTTNYGIGSTLVDYLLRTKEKVHD